MKRTKYERLIWIITAVGIVLTVILPFILTRTWGLITFEESSAQVGNGESDGFSNEVYKEKSIFERYKKETDELLKQLDKIGSRL